MAEHQEPKTTGHTYDGIEEYDNPVPGWWHMLWYASFVFAIVYMPVSLMSPYFLEPVERLQAAQAREFARLFADIGELENTEETLVNLMADQGWMEFGASVFKGNCVSCHGADAGGLIGPNLRDDHWKNVTAITDIYGTIANGAAAGAMPAWDNRLNQNEIILLSAYVASLRGTPASNGLDPEGDPIAPWPTAAEVASEPAS